MRSGVSRRKAHSQVSLPFCSVFSSFIRIKKNPSASIDNLRLWNVAEAAEADAFGKVKSGVQFKIIPGHHGGYISQMCTSFRLPFHPTHYL